jgi:hypothetical protein
MPYIGCLRNSVKRFLGLERSQELGGSDWLVFLRQNTTFGHASKAGSSMGSRDSTHTISMQNSGDSVRSF